MSDDLLGMIQRLRIENEVNKIMIKSLQNTLLHHKNEKINECLEHIEFVSKIVEDQIRDSWSLSEAVFFRQLIDKEIQQFTIIYDSN